MLCGRLCRWQGMTRAAALSRNDTKRLSSRAKPIVHIFNTYPVGMCAMVHARDHNRTWHDIVPAHTPCSSTVRHDRETTMRLVSLVQELMLVELEKTRTCASPTQVDEDEHFKHWTRINIRYNSHALSLTAVVDNTGKKICSFGHEGALCKTKLAYICLSSCFLGSSHPFCLPSPSTPLLSPQPHPSCKLDIAFYGQCKGSPNTKRQSTHKPCETNGQFLPNMLHHFGEFLNLVVSNLAVRNFYAEDALWHCCVPFCVLCAQFRVSASDRI